MNEWEEKGGGGGGKSLYIWKCILSGTFEKNCIIRSNYGIKCSYTRSVMYLTLKTKPVKEFCIWWESQYPNNPHPLSLDSQFNNNSSYVLVSAIMLAYIRQSATVMPGLLSAQVWYHLCTLLWASQRYWRILAFSWERVWKERIRYFPGFYKKPWDALKLLARKSAVKFFKMDIKSSIRQ